MPTGRVALVSALLGSTMAAVAWPMRNRKSGSSSLFTMTRVKSSTARTVSIVAKVRLSLLVLFSPPARWKAKRTVWALNGSPLWNLTSLRRRKV